MLLCCLNEEEREGFWQGVGIDGGGASSFGRQRTRDAFNIKILNDHPPTSQEFDSRTPDVEIFGISVEEESLGKTNK